MPCSVGLYWHTQHQGISNSHKIKLHQFLMRRPAAWVVTIELNPMPLLNCWNILVRVRYSAKLVPENLIPKYACQSSQLEVIWSISKHQTDTYMQEQNRYKKYKQSIWGGISRWIRTEHQEDSSNSYQKYHEGSLYANQWAMREEGATYSGGRARPAVSVVYA